MNPRSRSAPSHPAGKTHLGPRGLVGFVGLGYLLPILEHHDEIPDHRRPYDIPAAPSYSDRAVVRECEFDVEGQKAWASVQPPKDRVGFVDLVFNEPVDGTRGEGFSMRFPSYQPEMGKTMFPQEFVDLRIRMDLWCLMTDLVGQRPIRLSAKIFAICERTSPRNLAHYS
jgi:hypothetical protein